MSELKATPGPWKHTLRNANEIMTTFHGVQIGRIYIDVTTDNEQEDARLIAAAPELYEALESTSRELNAAIGKINELLEERITATDMEPPDYWDGQTLHENGLLLAKARGES